MSAAREADELRSLGYVVEISHPDKPVTLRVDGFGLVTYVLADDEETLASLVASHESRLAPPPEL